MLSEQHGIWTSLMEITPIIKINVVGGEGASGIHEIQFFKRLPYETTFIVNVDFMKFQIIYFSSVCPFKYTKFLKIYKHSRTYCLFTSA